MKPFIVFTLAIILSFSIVFSAQAQSSEVIWLTTDATSFKTGETVTVLVNAVSVTPIQGFTFQIRYDPACLKPVNAASPIPGMNGLSLPQTTGLVDASFASTTPQIANGVLAEVRFVTLGGCQTNLVLESAALAVRNAQGFAAPLPGVKVETSTVVLAVDSAPGDESNQALAGTPLALDPGGDSSGSNTPMLLAALLGIVLVGGLGFIIYKAIDRMGPASQIGAPSSRNAVVQFRHGPQAGKSFALKKVPFVIGRDPSNDICLNDPFIQGQHVRIYVEKNRYYLMDLGGETFVNGRQLKSNAAVLNTGDVVRLGKKTSFVFGY